MSLSSGGNPVDLHTHSTASDGLLSPAALVAEAAARGVRYLGLTDHDTVDGIREAQQAGAALGVEVIPGVELRTSLDGGEGVHLLGYFIDITHPELQDALARQATLAEELRTEQAILEERRAGLRAADDRLQSVREDRDVIRGRLEEARIRRAALTQEAGHLAAQFREEFHQEPAEEPSAVPDNLAEMEIDLGRVKDQIEKIGPVNILAGEEFTEQEQRHEFLTAQKADGA